MVSKILLVRNVIQDVLGIQVTPEDADTIIERIEALQAKDAVEQPLAPDGDTHLCGGKYYTDKVLGEVCCRCQAPRR
jgi:hypothetical protein